MQPNLGITGARIPFTLLEQQVLDINGHSHRSRTGQVMLHCRSVARENPSQPTRCLTSTSRAFLYQRCPFKGYPKSLSGLIITVHELWSATTLISQRHHQRPPIFDSAHQENSVPALLQLTSVQAKKKKTTPRTASRCCSLPNSTRDHSVLSCLCSASLSSTPSPTSA